MKKLGSLNKAAAWLIAAAMILIAVFGIGGLKLSSKYNTAEKNFTKACTGSFSSDYTSVLGYAGQIEAYAVNILGSDNPEARLLTQAIANAKACSGDYAKAYVAAEDLYTNALSAYKAIKRADPASAENVKSAFTDFSSNCDVIHNTYFEAYNEYNNAINDLKGGFPTSVIKSLWGIGTDEK